jgi:hypothetical protein
MKKFKIKIDRPGIPDEKILAHKTSFTKLMHTVKVVPKPFYKSGWFMGGAAGTVITTVTLVSIYFNGGFGTNKNPENNSDTLKTKSFVEKPFANQDIPYETYVVSSNCTHQLTTNSGTNLRIPQDAFTDSLGNPVSFPIELKYREFRNPVDFFVAGIPMKYDSAGTDYTFESAGMLELRAFKDGKELLLAKDKTIGVDMKSPSSDKDFNIYYLDTNKRNWVYKGKDEVADIKESKARTTEKLNQTSKTELAGKPALPVKADKSKFVFKLAVDLKEFPELSLYNKVLFQVKESDKKFDPALYSVKWSNVKLEESSRAQNLYTLLLSKNDTTIKVPVIPVFDDKEYASAIKVYNDKLAHMKSEKQLRDSTIDDHRQQTVYAKNGLQQTTDMVTSMIGSEMKALRTWDISGGLGYWNCDRPRPPLKGKYSFKPAFTDLGGKPLTVESIYIIDMNVNALFSYGTLEEIPYNKRSDNVLWILTKDNKIGVIDPKVFAEVTEKTSTPVFHVIPLNSSLGIRKLKKLVTGNEDKEDNSTSALVQSANNTGTTNSSSNNTSTINSLIVNCYPNPYTDKATISFTLDEDNTARVDIYDISGSLIQTIFNSKVMKGEETKAEFNGESLPAGTYIYKLSTSKNSKIGKLVHSK